MTFLLAFSMAASAFGTMPVYAMEPASVNIEAAGQEAAQSETQSELEEVQEEVREETDTDDSSIQKDDSGNMTEESQNEMKEGSGNPEQP